MKLTKNVINVLGIVSCGAVAVGGTFLGVIPQFENASVNQEQAEVAKQNSENRQNRIEELEEHAENMNTLESELSSLRASIPVSADVSNIQRSIVESLGSNMTLSSFSHSETTSYSPPEASEPSLDGTPEPFGQEGDGESSSGSAETSGPADTDLPGVEGEETGGGTDGSSGDSASSSPGGNIYATPIVIETSGGTESEFMDFLQRLESQDRSLLVVGTNLSVAQGGGDENEEVSVEQVNATIHLYAFSTGE